MQIGIQSHKSKPLVFNMSKDKANILLKFIHTFAENEIDENSEEYRQFLSDEITKAIKTKRVVSGASLREMIS